MNKPLLLSLAAVALLGTNLNAQTMYERFEAMEKEMTKLKQEIATLKSAKSVKPTKKVGEEAESDAEDDEAVASKDKESTDKEEVVSEDKGKKATTVAASSEDEEEEGGEEIASNEDRLFELEEAVSELNRNTSGSHLKFQVDYRFAIENMDYEMADGSKAKNDAFMTNRLWIDMGYKATNNLSFIGQLAYNKAFGERSGTAQSFPSWENIDWIANENAYDDKIRVRTAYFLWQEQEFFGLDIPWTFSIGRRPSTGGQLVNLRDDDHANSPSGHTINVEFDGLSSQFTLNKEWGTSVKLCLGRGMSNAAPKFATAPYAEVDTENTSIDIAGLIFTPFDNKQYKFSTMYYYAENLIDAHLELVDNPATPAVDPTPTPDGTFDTVGGLHSAAAYFNVNGIGKGWSDFLDDTTFFASYAVSVTNPNNDSANLVLNGMLGSTEMETGTSIWVGTQFPSLLTDNGKWGLEFNHGSKYWRPITYGEDTNIGSKLAARGDAYEAYFTEYLVDDILSMQLRYTYINYDYTGSNGFFGNSSGTPTKIVNGMANTVESAQDIRLYIRYRY